MPNLFSSNFIDESPHLSERQVGSLWQRIDAERHRRARRRRQRWQWSAGVASAACVVLGVMLAADHRQSRDGWADARQSMPLYPATLTSGSRSRRLLFADGSRITLAPRSAFAIEENSASSLSSRLQAGRGEFYVQPGGKRRWSITCGRSKVEVVGTQFSLECRKQNLTLRVQHGKVRVLAKQLAGGMQEVGVGGSLSVRAELDENGSRRIDAPLPAPQAVDVPPADTTKERLPMPRQDWATQQLEAADAARRRDDVPGALKALQTLIARLPGSAPAAVAAFTLARIHLDDLQQPREAIAWLLRAEHWTSDEALAEDTLARLVEAYALLGATRERDHWMAEYRWRFPHGYRLASPQPTANP